jgi:GT2 family glycosyltransferase
MNLISVIIPTINAPIKLYHLIKILNNQNYKCKFEILIINQSLKNGFDEAFYRSNNCKYFKVAFKNLSEAKNFGIRKSISEYISFLDDDVIVKKNFFTKAINFFENNNCSILFGNIINVKNNKPISLNMGNKVNKINFSNLDTCMSSAMWIKLISLNKKILFDKKLGLGNIFGSGEETDFLIKSILKKVNIYYYPLLKIYHPDIFDNLKKRSEIFKKFYSYGLGQGALFKKILKINQIIFIYLYSVSLLKSLIFFFYSIFKFDTNNSLKSSALFLGKIKGLYTFK